jgi:hypothetical protein
MKSVAIFAAASLAVASFGLLPASAATPPTTAPSPMSATVKLSGESSHPLISAAPQSEIEKTITRAVDDALTPKDMSKLVSTFASAQQHSISKSSTFSEGYGPQLNGQIKSLSQTWKQKYGDHFDIAKAHDVFSGSFATIKMGSPMTGNAKTESARVTIQSPTGAAKFDVPLVCEGKSDWKINVSNSLTAEKLRDNLVAQLTEVNHNSAHWPASQADAYRMVSHHVLAAITGQPLMKHGQASAVPAPSNARVVSSQSAAVKPVSATSTSNRWYQFWKW